MTRLGLFSRGDVARLASLGILLLYLCLDQPLSVAQDTNCSPPLEPQQAAVGFNGGTGSFYVPIPAECGVGWYLQSQANWISIQSVTSGNVSAVVGSVVKEDAITSDLITVIYQAPPVYFGDQTVTYAVAPNDSTLARTGTVTVGTYNNQQFTVIQEASPCNLAILRIGHPPQISASAKTMQQPTIVRVRLRNQDASPLVIPDAAALTNLVSLQFESLGSCPSPTISCVHPTRFPITLRSRGKLTVSFSVTFACVNDPNPGGQKNAGPSKYFINATTSCGALSTYYESYIP